jgi:hypothetical protein
MFLSRTDLLDLLVQIVLLIPANYLLVLYLSTPEIEGPFGIFSWIRSRAGIRPVMMTDMDTGEKEVVGYEHDGTFFAQLLSCHRCFSPWSSAGLVILSWLIGFAKPDPTNIIIWLSVSGATVYLLE